MTLWIITKQTAFYTNLLILEMQRSAHNWRWFENDLVENELLNTSGSADLLAKFKRRLVAEWLFS